MRITAVEVFGVECDLPAPLRWGTMEVATKGGVLVRLRTDEGWTGWARWVSRSPTSPAWRR